jgi:hypothetical protein
MQKQKLGNVADGIYAGVDIGDKDRFQNLIDLFICSLQENPVL